MRATKHRMSVRMYMHLQTVCQKSEKYRTLVRHGLYRVDGRSECGLANGVNGAGPSSLLESHTLR